MRRLAQQFFDLLRKRSWLKRKAKPAGHTLVRPLLEALEDRFLPATSVGQVMPATLTGTAFIDHSGNGILNSTDIVLPGAIITLTGTDATTGKSVSATATTNASGVYKFLQVDPGTYQLSITTNGNFVNGGTSAAGSQGGTVSGSVISSISIVQGETLVGYNLAVEGLANVGISLRQFLSTTLIVDGIPVFSTGNPVSNPGTGIAYADGAPPPAFLVASGTGSLAGVVMEATGNVTSVQITSGGNGYTSAPSVTFSGGGAITQATGTAVLTGNTVTSVTIDSGGSGYTSAPTVTFSAPTSGVTATGTTVITPTPVAGVTIGLTGVTASNSSTSATLNNGGLPTFTSTTTAADGSYSFSNISAGTYSINVVSQPAGFRAGVPTLGSLDGYISNNETFAGVDVTTIAGTGYDFVELPVAAPTGSSMEAHLVDDTAGPGGTLNAAGGQASDKITSDPTVGGNIVGVGTITGLTGFIDSGSTIPLPLPNANGSFLLSRAYMNQLAGGTLADGQHTLHLTATGMSGSVSTNLTFTLLTAGPTTPTVHLDTTSDPSQDNRPTSTSVTILVHTSPSVTVNLVSGTSIVATQTSNASGDASFSQTLNQGPNDFTIIAIDQAGNQSQNTATFTVDRPPTGTIPNQTGTLGTNPTAPLDLASMFTDPDTSDTMLVFHTNQGNINVQLADGQAPQTVANFLDYINSGLYNSTLFERLATGFVLQVGGYTFAAAPQGTITSIVTGPDVAGEAPATAPANGNNNRGTLAMALSSGPNTGNSQYFFNLVNNTSALDGTTDGGPFTIFGTIADGFSQRLVDNMASSPKIVDESSNVVFNTVQTVDVDGNPTGGTFTLSLGGVSSAPIAFNADKAAIAAAVAGLPNPNGPGTIGSANVTVGTNSNGEFVITFIGDLAGLNIGQFGAFSNLTGGTSPSVAVAVVTPGTIQNTVQTITVAGSPTGGTFTIGLMGGTSSPLPFNASPQAVAAAIAALPSPKGSGTVGADNIQVTSPSSGVYTVTFVDALGGVGTSSFQLSTTSSLTGGTNPTVSVAVTTEGSKNNGAFTTVPELNYTGTNFPSDATDSNLEIVNSISIARQSEHLTYTITNNSNPAVASASLDAIFNNRLTLQFLSAGTTSITVVCTDMSNQSVSSTFTVTVNAPTSNLAPIISPQTLTAAAGSAVNTVIGTVQAHDPQNETLTYTITGGNTDNTFALNSSTGQLTVASSADLVLASHPSFALTVQVTNGGTPNVSSSAQVTVNLTANQAPVISAQTMSAAVGSPNGTVIGTVAASDPDPGTLLTYAFTGGNSDGFAINASTGQITIVDNTQLSAGTSVPLTVKVTDNNSTPLSDSATVTINETANSAPTIAAQTFFAVLNSASGTDVGTVVASDPDPGQILAYHITVDNSGGLFSIDPNTGVITTTSAITTAGTYTLTVDVNDNDSTPLSDSAIITITVPPSASAPTINPQSFNVIDGSPNGTQVNTVVATDTNNDPLSFAIISGNANNTFAINSSTGLITVNNNTFLNKAFFSSFNLTVQVTDTNLPSLLSSNVITLNVQSNNAPTITAGQVFTVAHGSAVGTAVSPGPVAASDPDPGQTVTSYSIIAGNLNNTFQIDPSSGQISVANNTDLTTANSPFTLTILVTDDDARPLSFSTQVTVNVT